MDKAQYASLLLKCNQVADNLEFKIQELEIVKKDLNDSELETKVANNKVDAIAYQLNNQKEYIKYLKKKIRKSWFNGIWQGALGMLAAIASLLLL